jgi:putative oxidoreductase
MSIDVGLLVVRLLFGLAIAAHGAQIIWGWFGGYGLKRTGGAFETIGFRPGAAFAAAAGAGEFAGGILFVLGLLTPVGAVAVLSAMLVAMAVNIKGGFFAAGKGIELPFLFAAAALGIVFTGPGAISLDSLLGLHVFEKPAVVWALLVLAVIGTGGTLALRRSGAGARAPDA